MKDKIIKSTIASIIFFVVYILIFYITLPVINFQNFSTYIYISILFGYVCTIVLYLSQDKIIKYFKKSKKNFKRVVITNNEIKISEKSVYEAFSYKYLAFISYVLVFFSIIIFYLV